MSGHRNFGDLRKRMSTKRERTNASRAAKMLTEMPLQELRQARELSQNTLARLLGVTQPEISKIEKRTDMYLSTIRDYIEAMGGTLEVLASFPEGTVRISQFEALGKVAAR
jgi:DNA-binding XRE family transcriptional regulator